MAFWRRFARRDRPIMYYHTPHLEGAASLRVTNIGVRYESLTALEDLSFELEAGERVAVVGPNGAGKSTLFKVIAGVLPPTQGKVEIFGHEPGVHLCIAYLPQRSQVDWDFPVSVADVVMMGRIGKIGLVRWPKPRDWELVQHSLQLVGMQHLAGRQISELSGGQQQRMFIARALAQEAELMLMDEPLTGLDVQSQDEIFHVLEILRAQEVTVMVAMHDLDLAANQFDRVMLLNRRLVGLGRAEQVFTPELLVAAYGGQMRLVQTNEGLLVLNDSCCEDGVVHDDALG
jgi:ABC-type Mn2+/Zn2+ transport system ATPase subunit